MLLEDLRIKHLAALVSQQVGASVSICGLSIDPFGPYHDVDENGEPIDGTDMERCVIAYCEWGEGFGKEQKVGFFEWLCESEELVFEFDMTDDVPDGDFFTYDWNSLQEEQE